ncbi:MAG: autotransporter outer membrane beta-barrel domain-containing protein [Gemmatimonadota bacterium]|nr:autotransporter outer membrane beta-barrel domain-containing protein [Gemmatimonadota bacterium]
MALVGLLAALPGVAQAQTWTGTASSDWTDGSNWSTGTAPTNGGSATIFINTDTPNPTVGDQLDFSSISTLVIGTAAGSAGSLSLENGSQFKVGQVNLGNGTLNVLDSFMTASRVDVEGHMLVKGSTASLTVSGLTNYLEIGKGSGWGSFTASDGATVSARHLILGNGAGSGEVIVDNASINLEQDLTVVGSIGDTNLTVKNGGTITLGRNFELGNSGGTDASLTITGAGSKIEALTGRTIIGYSFGGPGVAHAVISDHGVLSSKQIEIGYFNVATGDVLVTDGGSIQATDNLNIGGGIAGRLTLTNGGTASAGQDIAIAQFGNYAGDVLVTGSESRLDAAGDLAVGLWGNGSLTLSDGGTVGVGGDLYVGLFANDNYTSSGVLNIGAAQGEAAAAAGFVEASSLHFGDGEGSLVFNHTSADYAFDTQLIGAGVINHYSGTTTLTADNSAFDGGTNVYGGVLRAGVVNSFSPNSAVTVGAAGTLDLAGHNQTVAGLTNAGLVSFGAGSAPGTVLTVDGNYVGSGGSTIALNTVFGGDDSATDKLVIRGGQASGTTTLIFTNVGGPGAETTQGIRVVETTDGATTTPTAFTLGGERYMAGAYEYFLKRTGQDWYLANGLRPEVPEYGPIPAMGRSLGLFTIRTLHERVGEEENLRGQAEKRSVLNGIWARMLSERQTTSFSGAGNASVNGTLWAMQGGLDLYRHTTAGGSRNHFGTVGSYSGFSSNKLRGNALGDTDADLGELELKGPSMGAYWTHFSPSGWYLDAVGQASWYKVKATSLSGTRMETDMDGITASLETGYPIHIGTNGMWVVEPQAQLIWQGFNVDGHPGSPAGSTLSTPATIRPEEDSPVAWNTADAWTGRLGLRVQQSCKCGNGPLWQRYGRINVWRKFNGADGLVLDTTAPVDTRFGGTMLEGGLGMTVKTGRLLSIYTESAYHHSVGGAPQTLTGIYATLGLRLNW